MMVLANVVLQTSDDVNDFLKGYNLSACITDVIPLRDGTTRLIVRTGTHGDPQPARPHVRSKIVDVMSKLL